MTIFFRLISEKNKEKSLQESCSAIQKKAENERIFEVSPDSFLAIPGAPFAYWVSDYVRNSFARMPSLDGPDRIARVTNPAGDDTRFIRAWWEVSNDELTRPYRWVDFSKGGSFSPYFYDIHLVVCWNDERQTYHGFVGTEHRPLEKPACLEHFFRPGLTWPRRTNGLSFRAMPRNCIFADKGPAAFIRGDKTNDLMALCGIVNSKAFGLLMSTQLARTELAQSFEVGLVQQTPVPVLNHEQQLSLARLARRAWRMKRILDTVGEVSHAFHLPVLLRARLGHYDPPSIEAELADIQSEIDQVTFDLYGFSEADRAAALGSSSAVEESFSDPAENPDDIEDDDSGEAIDQTDGLLSWALGVSFGRFDWSLATGERAPPPEPDPFDPLPAKSPGMLPDGAVPFHAHSGILADDRDHPHYLPRLIEEVLARVDSEVPGDVRLWLQRDFFALHLKQYTKSRRKAPIYWPLSTSTGSYTLWLYYPQLTSQTLYTAVNDFVEPKLKQVSRDAVKLRDKGTDRTRDDDRVFEALQTLELELIELLDILLQIAPTYRPNHDDGVQITAAPLWPLFRHKPWQKLLKETWVELEKGEYDWAQLAMVYWPDRVREKCKTDKSLAIAHNLEHLYVPPEPKAVKRRARRKASEA
jgi:hypothetical protein